MRDGSNNVRQVRRRQQNQTDAETKTVPGPERLENYWYSGGQYLSLLTAHNTNSAPKRLRDKREYKGIANACLSFVQIGPQFIPLLRDAKPIEFGAFNQEEKDPVSGCYVHYAVARLEKGIPNPKERPVIPLPWSIEFDFTLFPNKEIKEQEIVNLISEAGMAIGLGTFRGVFGKYMVEKWEPLNE